VEVTAPDITGRLLFNIEVVNGVATGSITIPAGADRTVTARAFDARGIVTHQGSKVVTVKGGTNTSITITMVPTAGEQPLTINFGALIVQVSRVPSSVPVAVNPETGDTVRYRAAVRNADGTAVDGTVRWASLNASIATVDSAGLVTARKPGPVEIVATYQGAGGSATLTVRGDGTGGSVDQTAPRITGVTASADSLDLAAGDTVLTFTVSATDAGTGVSRLHVSLYAPGAETGESGQTQVCSTYAPSGATGPANQVSWTCKVVFSRHNAPGTWILHNVQVADVRNNGRFVNRTQLAAAGIDVEYKIVNSKPDLAAPTVSAITIAPDSINLTTATDTTVTVTVTASDPGAGVEYMGVSFRTPTGAYGPDCFVYAYFFSSPTTNQVTWSCQLRLPRAGAAGTYTLDSVYIRDRVGNSRNLTAAQVTAAGFESSFKAAK
jgi:hypothetical protein